MDQPAAVRESLPKHVWSRQLARAVFAFLCVETLFSTAYRSVSLSAHSITLSWAAGIAILAVTLVCFRKREEILIFFAALAADSHRFGNRWFSFWLVLGLAIRILWALCFPITLKSDNIAYFTGAEQLAFHHSYPGAFWPPGFALFLTPFIAVLGARPWVVLLCCLLLFSATYFITLALARSFARPNADPQTNDLSARIACMLVAVWPTYFTLAQVNAKETLLAVLIPASILLYLKSDSLSGRLRLPCLIGAGMCVGGSALTQPSFLLFPSVILLFEFLRRGLLATPILRTAIFSLAMLLVILPWADRNYHLFHRVVLISTNGGSVFYRANNPDANASYSPRGEFALPADEFLADKQGYAAGEAWIRANPAAFTVLMIRKQVNYLGDDGIGVYESLKRDLDPSPLLYGLAKGICNFFWLALWFLILLGTPTLFRQRSWLVWFGLCCLPMLYQWAIDAVFESAGRHHVPYIPLIAVTVGIILGNQHRPHISTPAPHLTLLT